MDISISMLSRTKKVLSKKILKTLKEKTFCIIGCGGTGCMFAEMLVRTGAQHIILIDGDKVEKSNLNRIFSFVKADVGKPKVDALEARLKEINENITVDTHPCHFKQLLLKDDAMRNIHKDILNSFFVFIGVDENCSRLEIEKLLKGKKPDYLSTGIGFNNSQITYECSWLPKTPRKSSNNQGYGPGNGSFIAPIAEAVSVAFIMLLGHLDKTNPAIKYFYKEYKNFVPSECEYR